MGTTLGRFGKVGVFGITRLAVDWFQKSRRRLNPGGDRNLIAVG